MVPQYFCKMTISSCNMLYIFYWITLHISPTKGDFDIQVSAPVNPVDSGGILSVYCHVGTIQDGHSVQIFRISSGVPPTMLSINDKLLVDDDERLFLAVRQLADGTFVYLLSVMYARSSDGGLYQCKIINPYENTKIAEDSVDISFVYFPNTENPVCDGDTELLEGTRTTFTCSSDAGNPVVNLEWEKSGGSLSRNMRTEKDTSNGKTSMDLFVIATKELHNAVFTCKLTSSAFPSKLSTCHIGPLTITPRSPSMTIPVDLDIHTESTQRTDQPGEGNSVSSENIIDKCKDQCDLGTSGFFWIITTVISGVFAVVFCIIVVVLFVKYYHISSDIDTVDHRIPHRPVHGGIYDELTTHSGLDHRERCKMYMSLERSKNPDGYYAPQQIEERQTH